MEDAYLWHDRYCKWLQDLLYGRRAEVEVEDAVVGARTDPGTGENREGLSRYERESRRTVSLFESHRHKMGCATGNPARRVEPRESDFLDSKGSCDAARRLCTAEMLCDVLGVHVGTCETNYDVLCTCRRNIQCLTILEIGQGHVNRNRCCEKYGLTISE